MNGYRLMLDHVSFVCKEKAPVSAAARRVVQSLNQALSPEDRLQVFLSDGGRFRSLVYGKAGRKSSLWRDASPPADQSELFDTLRVGDCVTLYGKCSQFERATNPGQFDRRQYYLARRIVLKMSEVSLQALQRPGGLPAFPAACKDLICDLRIGLQKGLLDLFGPEDASLAAAFVLGDSSSIEPETKSLFQNGGLSWLVSVSGLHISLLGMMLYRLFRSRGILFLPSSLMAYAAVAGYALLTGFSLSAQRALILFAFFLGSQIFGRTKDTLTALSAAVCVILIRQPYALRDGSFLISASCIVSVEYLAPFLSGIWKLRRSMQRRFCTSFALWIGALPAVLWFYYQTCPYTVILYPVMLPLMSLFLGFGLPSALVGGVYVQTGLEPVLTAGRILSWPCRFLLSFARWLCTLERRLPFGVLILGRPALWQVTLYYAVLAALIFLVRRIKRKRRSARAIRLVTAGILGTIVLLLCLRKQPEFRFTCLDIGQGSCNLIEYQGCAYLFDAGSSSVENVWQYRIDSTLKYYGIRRLDVVFLSHGDMDHVNGVEQMLEQYQTNLIGYNAGDVTIGSILVPDLPAADERLASVLHSAAEHGIATGCVSSTTVLKQRDLTLKILSPSPDRITGRSNEDCIVLLLTCPDLRILLTGDLEKEGEDMFVREYARRGLYQSSAASEGGLTVLIAGHHGSKNATSDALLGLVRPDLVLISCGRNNRYGHPSVQMLKRLDRAGILYRRTDLCGAQQVIRASFG